METARGAVGLEDAPASTQGVSSLIRDYWNAFLEWRKYKNLQSDLNELTDRELRDIGIARGEIDYVATTRSIDPRGVRSQSVISNEKGAPARAPSGYR